MAVLRGVTEGGVGATPVGDCGPMDAVAVEGAIGAAPVGRRGAVGVGVHHNLLLCFLVSDDHIQDTIYWVVSCSGVARMLTMVPVGSLLSLLPALGPACSSWLYVVPLVVPRLLTPSSYSRALSVSWLVVTPSQINCKGVDKTKTNHCIPLAQLAVPPT